MDIKKTVPTQTADFGPDLEFVLLPAETSSCTQRRAPSSPTTKPSGILTEREFLVTAFGDLISRPPEMRAVAIVARNPAHGPTCDVAIDAVPPRIDLERQ
jgi:hypothetical protein